MLPDVIWKRKCLFFQQLLADTLVDDIRSRRTAHRDNAMIRIAAEIRVE